MAIRVYGIPQSLHSLVKEFHTKYSAQSKSDFVSDTTFLNYAHAISKGFLTINDLFSALKYNKIEQQFYDKIKQYSNNKTYLNRVLYECVYSRIMILERKESYNEALDLAYALLKTCEENKQDMQCADIEEEIGYIYYSFENFSKALVYFKKSHEVLLKTTHNASKIGGSYINLYAAYASMGDSITAIKYCFSALNFFKKIDHKEGMRVAYGNLAIYYQNINTDKALSYILQSMSLRNGSIDFLNPGLDENSLGNLYFRKAKLEKNPVKKKALLMEAETSFEKAKRIATLTKSKGTLKDCYRSLAVLEKERGDLVKAYDYINLYTIYKDSILKEENTGSSLKSALRYEFDKKEQKQKLLAEQNQAVKQSAFEKQKIQKNFFIIGFILVSIFAIFIFVGLRAKQKANKIIIEQKTEVQDQKMIIEQKQSQLLQSIHYAQSIQNNLLKSETDLQKIIPDSFIIFKPRDIVSGDFYWFTKTEAGDIIIAIGDCTGHGVPGALLSMIGITSLNEIVNFQKKHDPGDILKGLSVYMHTTFSKDRHSKIDGMDFSICKISAAKNKLYFAGVNQCLYAFNVGSGLLKIEPQVSSIDGIFDISGNDKIISKEIDVVAGTCFYVFSDGIIDQIGELTGKKYLSKRFEESLFSEKATSSVVAQKEVILSSLGEWQGNFKQIDDISVIGFKL